METTKEKVDQKDKPNDNPRFVPLDETSTAIYGSSFIVYHTAMQVFGSLKRQSITTTKNTLTFANHYLQKNPSIRNFAYTTAILSLVPLAIFSLVFMTSFVLSVATAIAGVVLIQGGVILAGLTILLPVEVGIICIAGGATALLKGVGNERFVRLPKRVVTTYESFLIKEKEEMEEDENTIVM